MKVKMVGTRVENTGYIEDRNLARQQDKTRCTAVVK